MIFVLLIGSLTSWVIWYSIDHGLWAIPSLWPRMTQCLTNFDKVQEVLLILWTLVLTMCFLTPYYHNLLFLIWFDQGWGPFPHQRMSTLLVCTYNNCTEKLSWSHKPLGPSSPVTLLPLFELCRSTPNQPFFDYSLTWNMYMLSITTTKVIYKSWVLKLDFILHNYFSCGPYLSPLVNSRFQTLQHSLEYLTYFF